MNCLLADVGSTFIKYGVYDTGSHQMRFLDKLSFPDPCVNDGIHFRVPEYQIREKIFQIFDNVSSYRCKKSFFAVQMHGYVMRDKAGNFSEYVSWRDKCGNTKDSRFAEIDFYHMGTSLKTNLPLVKLAFRNTDEEFFTLGSYIAWILTGKNETHITDACPSGFFDAQSGVCNTYAENMKMPKVHLNVDPVGIYRDILVYTPMGDHQISFLGSDAGEDKYLVNIGTAAQISCLDDAALFCEKCEARPFFLPEKRLYTVSGLIGGSELIAGNKEAAFCEQLAEVFSLLPPKKEILLGGGGAGIVYETVKRHFTDQGISCQLIAENIGMEGLKKVAEQKRIKAGTMLSEIAFPNFPVIAKTGGLDFFIIDNEHGYFDYSVIAALVMNANLIGMNTIVRIGDNSRSHITKLADMGVKGFLLPMTNMAAEIEEVVKYAKYAPVGKRGVSTARAHTLYNPPPLSEYMEAANREMKIYAQIETGQGVENVREILAVNGVDGLFVGPNDLSVDLGCISDKEMLYDCLVKIAQAAKEFRKTWGIITGDKKLLEWAQHLDVDQISCGSELNMMLNGCKQITASFTMHRSES